MSYPIKIHFTPRTTDCDWSLIQSVINEYAKSVANINGDEKIKVRGIEKQWITDKINLLCMEVIVPLLASYKNKTTPCERIMPQFHISNKRVKDHGSIDLLKEFARIKQKTVADIIQIYIIDKLVLEQERKEIICL